MFIQTKIRIDGKGLPYWSARLIQEGEVVYEVHSKTINPTNKKQCREALEDVMVGLINNLEKKEEYQDIMHMMIQEDHKKDFPT